MGSRGPAPKRNAERRRRNTESRAERVEAAGVVRVPACPRGLHPRARAWYLSLKSSGQARYYEPSDWQSALLLAEQWSRYLESGEAVPASAFAALWSAMGDLLAIEGPRRRARLEVERKAPKEEAPPAGIVALAKFRKQASA